MQQMPSAQQDAATNAAEANAPTNTRGPMRSLPQVKDKIMKYDSFLQKNRTELNSKEF